MTIGIKLLIVAGILFLLSESFCRSANKSCDVKFKKQAVTVIGTTRILSIILAIVGVFLL